MNWTETWFVASISDIKHETLDFWYERDREHLDLNKNCSSTHCCCNLWGSLFLLPVSQACFARWQSVVPYVHRYHSNKTVHCTIYSDDRLKGLYSLGPPFHASLHHHHDWLLGYRKKKNPSELWSVFWLVILLRWHSANKVWRKII